MHTMRDDACRMIYKLLQEYGVLTGEKQPVRGQHSSPLSAPLVNGLRHACHCWHTSTNLVTLTRSRDSEHLLDSSVTQPPHTASSEDNIRDLRELLVMLRMIWLDNVAINLQHQGLDQIGL